MCFRNLCLGFIYFLVFFRSESKVKRNIFDEPIPNDPTPVLQPTPWRPSNIALKNKQNIKNFAAKNMQKTKNFFTMGMQKIKDFVEWLLNYSPPKPKVVDKVLKSLKTKLKKFMKRETVCSNKHRPNLL